MELSKYQKAYNKLLKKYCGKCESRYSLEKYDCCFNFIGVSPKIVSIIKKRGIKPARLMLLDDKGYSDKEIISCPAYNSSIGCTAKDYRSKTCRETFCSNWDNEDKELIVKGSFQSISADKLVNHIRKIHPHVSGDVKYLILTNSPDSIGDLMKREGFDTIYIDVNASFTSLDAFSKSLSSDIVITNTSLEDFLNKDYNNASKWHNIKSDVLSHYLFIVN